MLENEKLETDHSIGACQAFRVAGMRVVDIRELEGAVKQLEDLLDHCRDMAAGKMRIRSGDGTWRLWRR